MRFFNDLLTFVGPILLFYLLIRVFFIKKFKINIIKEFVRISFIAYISALIFIVWISHSLPADYLLYNFIPFKTIFNYITDLFIAKNPTNALINIFGNILITLPIGLYAYIFWRDLSKAKLILFAISIPLIIETVQYLLFLGKLGRRTVDIDDVILNSSGILMGYYFIMYFFKKIPKKLQKLNSYKG